MDAYLFTAAAVVAGLVAAVLMHQWRAYKAKQHEEDEDEAAGASERRARE